MSKRFKEKENKVKKETERKPLNTKMIAIVSGLVLLGGISGFGVYKLVITPNNTNNNQVVIPSGQVVNVEPTPVKTELNIFKGDSRPIAVMIDNEKPAWPHAGLNDAYLLYEIIIEGGESRIMALYKGATTEKIGPVRSARHYFLDYAMENDAMYTHFGWSPLAQSDIKKYDINNLNGVTSDGIIFWREGSKVSYHNAFTSIKNIQELAEKKNYELKSTDKGVFKYSLEERNLKSGNVANIINIKYSGTQNVKYVYNLNTKLYERYMRGVAHKDRFTNEFFVAKNIVVCYVDNRLLDDPENKGRQELLNIGKGEGVYITNGEYIHITWEKKDRQSKTKYYDLTNEEIVLNDGITWVQIVPKANTISIQE